MAAQILARQGSPVDGVVSSLHSDKPSVRIWGLMQIAKLGEIKAAQYQLDLQVAPLVDDPDLGVQEQALKTLSLQGSRGARHCGVMAKKLATGAKQVQLAALSALGNLGAVASSQASEASTCLDHQDLDLVAGACKALGGMKATSVSSQIAQKLRSDDTEVAIAACEGLAAMDRETDAVARLLSSSQPRVRAAAALALKTMTRAEDFAQNLVDLVSDQDAYVRVGAAEALAAIGDKAGKHAAALGQCLQSAEPGVVAAAAFALGSMGSAAVGQVSALVAALANEAEDKSTHMLSAAGIMPKAPAELRKPACAAAAALGNLGSGASVPKLVDCLNSKDWEIRAAAIQALSKLGSDSARFESNLIDLLKDPSPVVVAAACSALGGIAAAGAPSASTAAAVAELLDDHQPSVRASAAESLGKMGDEAETFLEALCKLLNDKAWPVQVAAVKTIAGCGEMGQMYAADVCRLTMAGDARTQTAAIEALAQMGERGACFAEELEPLRDNATPEVAAAAHKALELFSSGKTAVPSIADLPKASAAPALEAPGAVQAAPATRKTLPIALLFPGQGSQYVKMLSDVQALPGVRSMLDSAREILGYDILNLCLEGPEEQLENTKYCQPAMYIGGLAGLELLKKENAKAAEQMQCVAGLSLGEYTALTAAGVFDFETGLKLVKLRGEAMQEAAEASPQKMISVAGLDQKTLDKLCKESLSGPNDICQVANFLFPNGFSCAGSEKAAETLIQKAQKTDGCLQAKVLKTSGAFHTKFMLPAREKLLKALQEAEPRMKPPTCEIYMNLTGKKIQVGSPVAEIVALLADQLTNCVLWEPAMKAMIKDGVKEFYECGPMKQLKAMMKRIDATAWKNTQNIHV
eukprot:TRINITY_DN76866_c0_g1_i1.p1 TRINITY_DN76866_c0_g1~~TRINITY_DN76866_c0_g1_i1.p1  ORF type:complete len:866 (-),score=282.80 TRINITY_DN76866_c0_g1_i1:78-2675(-)